LTHQDETQPKAPAGLKEHIHAHLEDTGQHPAIAAPLDNETEAPAPILRVLMMAGVLVATACMCLSIIALSGVAGARDEWLQIGTQAANTQTANLATQYSLGKADLAEGNLAMAEIRFGFIVTLDPAYQDAAQQLAQIQTQPSPSPTPPPTETPPPATTATPTSDDAQSPLPESRDPAALFGHAQSAMNSSNYEEAIAWFDALVLLDPNYRRAEVQEMRLNAHITQGRIYLRGQNEDGQDRLAQGVQLITRARELGNVPGELSYEADFVARYLAAKAYVEGRAYAQAREVLTRLCEEDCDWNYRGLSVRDLLAQTGGG